MRGGPPSAGRRRVQTSRKQAKGKRKPFGYILAAVAFCFWAIVSLFNDNVSGWAGEMSRKVVGLVVDAVMDAVGQRATVVRS